MIADAFPKGADRNRREGPTEADSIAVTETSADTGLKGNDTP